MTDPLSIAASVAGLLSLSQVFIELTCAYVTDVKSCPADLRELEKEVEGLCGVLLTLESAIKRIPDSRVLPAPSDPDGCAVFQMSANLSGLAMVVKCLDDCRSIIEEVSEALKKCNPKTALGMQKGVRALVWPFKKKNTQSRIDRLERHKQTFQLALLALNM